MLKFDVWLDTTVRWKGSEGSKQTKHRYYSKADALVIPEMYFFENLPTPFVRNAGFCKIRHLFSALLALAQ